MGAYIYNKRWRLKNSRIRGKGAAAYYNRHKYKGMNKKQYSEADKELIINKILNGKKMVDREIAKLLGRTLRAIQICRCRIREAAYDEGYERNRTTCKGVDNDADGKVYFM